MNKLLNKLERKIGRYAIPHLMYYVLGAYIIGYACEYISVLNPVLQYCYLDPYLVCRGQVWRLVSWLIIPPSTGTGFFGVFWAVVMLFMYYQLGRVLEGMWGYFKFNVYIIGGILITIVGVMAAYGFFYLILRNDITFFIQAETYIGASGMQTIGYFLSSYVSTYYINLSIFLAFALCFPDAQVRLWFIIPVKMKWMSIVYGAFIAYDIFSTVRYYVSYFKDITYGGVFVLVISASKIIVILLSLANFLLFYFSTKNVSKNSTQKMFNMNMSGTKNANSRPQMRREMYHGASTVYRHKCMVCGRTDADFPDLEFRFCSKCQGGREYCMDHLFTHTHQ